MSVNRIPPRASGGPTKAELQQMVQDAQTKEMLGKIADGFAIKLGAVFIAALNNFSPNLECGLRAMFNTLCSTAVRNKIPLEQLQERLAKEYAISEEAINKVLSGTAGAEDPQMGSVGTDGLPKPIHIVEH